MYPTFKAMAYVPVLGWLPLWLVVLGVGDSLKVVLVAQASLTPVVFNVFTGVRGVSPALIETKMAMCAYKIGTKSYNISNVGSTSAPAFFAKSIPGAKKFPYSAGGVDGIAMFAANGSAMVHIEPGLLIYYKFEPNIPAGRYSAVAKGGC